MTLQTYWRSKFVNYLNRCAKNATARALIGCLALLIFLGMLGTTDLHQNYRGTFSHSATKDTIELHAEVQSMKLQNVHGKKQVFENEHVSHTTDDTQDRPTTLLAAGDIAKCNGESSWNEEFLKLIHIIPDKGPPEHFLENVLELLFLKEETDYPTNAALTAKLVLRLPGKVLALGDLVYPTGSTQQFQECYESTWGQFKRRTYPVPGNHEYKQTNAQPYFDYWGNLAGQPGKGYYSFNAGAWHIIALNSKLEKKEHQSTISPQHAWLQHDLEVSNAHCILAYWHHPVFSSGQHSGTPRMKNILQTLYDFGATVVLAGHAHHYERFAPQNPEGKKDPIRGFRQFIVGTGGVPLRPLKKRHINSEVFQADVFGVLRLDLYSHHYAWEFIPVKDRQPYDMGKGTCVTPSNLDVLPPPT